jgi:hypothetical protein
VGSGVSGGGVFMQRGKANLQPEGHSFHGVLFASVF